MRKESPAVQALLENTRLLTVQECATYLGATVWAVRRLLMRGAIPTVQVGKRHNVAREDLDVWVNAERAKATAQG